MKSSAPVRGAGKRKSHEHTSPVMSQHRKRAGIALERSTAELAVRRSEERFRSLTELSSDLYWETDAEHRFTELVYGPHHGATQPKGSQIGKRRWEIPYLSPDEDGWRAHRQTLDAHLVFYDFEFSRRADDGEARHYTISGEPTFDGDGRFIGYRGTGHETTKRKLAEQALTDKTAALRNTLENIDQGISMVDADLRVVAWNRRFLALLDLPEALFNERTTFADVIRFNARRGEYGPGDVEEQVRQRVDLARRFEPHQFERARPDGTILEIRGNPLPGRGFVTTYTDVTARRHAEAALLEAKRRLQLSMEASKVSIWDTDLRTRQVYLSEGWAELLGEEPKESTTTVEALMRITHPADLGRVAAASLQVMKGKSDVYSEEHRVRTHGGQWRWVRSAGRVIQRDRDGRALRMAGTNVDIDDQKQAEQALREQTERLQIGQAAARMIIMDRDIPRDQLTWSGSPEWLRGPLPASGRYPLFKDQVHPEDRAMFLAARDKAIGSLQGGSLEFRVVRTDGEVLWVLSRQNVFADAAGKAVRMLAALLDITERKRAEDDLRRFRLAMDSSADMIVLVDRATMRFVDVNSTICRLLGYTREELLALPPENLLPVSRAELEAAYDRQIANPSVPGGMRSYYRCRDGSQLPFESKRQVLRAGDKWLISVVSRDIRESMKAEQELAAYAKQLEQLAQFDTLTGLPNRNLLQDRLQQTLVQTRRSRRNAAVLFIDLDRFKVVNDTFGHDVGDKLIAQVGKRLTRFVRQGDTVGRISGDEFTVVLADLMQAEDAAIVAQKILDSLAQPFDLGGNEAYVTASIGISIFPNDCDDAETLLKNADVAMYRAKKSSRNAFRFFTPKMNQRLVAKMQLNTDLRHALEREEFMLHFQPKVRLSDGGIVGMEALLRWNHPQRGMVSPAEFIPALEDSGLIVQVGEWVIKAACDQLCAWREAGLATLPVAVNLSARQFRERNLSAFISDYMRVRGLSASLLELEITESLLMEDPEQAALTLEALHAAGFKISIDDFGTGYSSLSYLIKFPLSALKVDRSFVHGAARREGSAAIVRAVIEMAHTLGFTVIAEGVEQDHDAAFLRQHGCEQAQGYLFGKPMPAAEIARSLAHAAAA